MKNIIFIFIFIIIVAFVSCMKSKHKSEKIQPAKVEKREGQDLPDVILTEKAVQRLGIAIKKLLPEKSVQHIPVSAILYDTKGMAWVYLNISPRTYHRQKVELIEVIKETAIIKNNLSVGSDVVIEGAAELFGAEHGVGK